MPPAAIDRSFLRHGVGRNEMSARRGKKHFGAMQHRPPILTDKLSAKYDSRRRADLKIRCALLLLIVSLGLAPSAARSQAYPAKPITLIVPFAPGAVTDLMARVAAELIRTQSGQSVVVENRPGASGNIGTRSVRACRSRRLHIGICHVQFADFEPVVFCRYGVRSDPRTRSGREHRRVSAIAGHQLSRAGNDAPRVHRSGKSKAGSAQLRVCWPGIRVSSGRSHIRVPGRH